MNTMLAARPLWATSSFGDSAEASPIETSSLARHLGACEKSRGRMFFFRCSLDSMHGFLLPRMVTSLVVIALLIGAGSFVL